MPFSSSDFLEYQSTATGSSGGAIAGSTITSGAMNNVWPDVPDSNRIAGGFTYRKTFWKNTNGTSPAVKPVIWTPVLPTNMTIEIGFGINHADDSDAGQGNLGNWTANAKVAVLSDGTDVRQVTIYGVDNAGNPVTENITLSNTAEILSANTYSKVWGVYLASLDGSRTVTIKQGSGGATRGTIGPSKKISFRWVSGPSTKAAGIALPDLPAGQSYGVWRRLSWTAGASPQKPNELEVDIEENA